jgi:hypothetical protein
MADHGVTSGSSPYTNLKEIIFGTDSESDSDVELSDESNVQDHVSAGSAVGSGKKRDAKYQCRLSSESGKYDQPYSALGLGWRYHCQLQRKI